jgi:hypothetical protein
MTVKKQTYHVDKTQQLIDLNDDFTNFDLTFTVTSADNSDFYALVVDMNVLNSGNPLDFKLAHGSISGNIISDNNVYQNLFLALKAADTPCDCEVTIEIKEIPFVKESYTITEYVNWKLWGVIGAIVIVAMIGGYYYYYYWKQDEKDEPILEPQLGSTTSSQQPTLSPQPEEKEDLPQNNRNFDLMSRLNSLPLRH